MSLISTEGWELGYTLSPVTAWTLMGERGDALISLIDGLEVSASQGRDGEGDQAREREREREGRRSTRDPAG